MIGKALYSTDFGCYVFSFVSFYLHERLLRILIEDSSMWSMELDGELEQRDWYLSH